MTLIFKKYVFLACLVSLFLLVSCAKEEKVQPEPVVRPVRTLTVFSTGGSRVRTFSGTSRAGLESKLSFKVGGTVQKFPVKVGDKVKKGEMIAQLDAQDYEVQVQASEAQLSQAKAQLRNAEANYKRIMQLYENNNTSLTSLDSARSAAESAKAQVHLASKQLQGARLQAGYTRLAAPVSGTIALVNAEINENIPAGHTIVVLTSGKNPEVEIAVPEVFISLIATGMQVDVTFDSIPGQVFKAVITEVGVSVSSRSSTYPVFVRLLKTSEAIRPGMTTEVSIHFKSPEDQKDIFLVPLAAVGKDQKGRFVFIAKPIKEQDEYATATRTAVTVGDLTENGIEISEGLHDGDHVITAGVSKIYNGQKVKLQP